VKASNPVSSPCHPRLGKCKPNEWSKLPQVGTAVAGSNLGQATDYPQSFFANSGIVPQPTLTVAFIQIFVKSCGFEYFLKFGYS
jgi:hypothetical protein